MLKRDRLEPNRYEYLDEDKSVLYDLVKNRADQDGITIRMLLEEIAASCRRAHAQSTY